MVKSSVFLLILQIWACNLLQFVNQKVTGKVMRNKWTLSGDLKSPGSDTVPVRFRLAAPRIPALSFEGAGIFLPFSVFPATSLKIFVPCVLAENFCLPTICQQISTKTCSARRHTAFSPRNSTHSFEAYSTHRKRTFP